MRGRPAVPEDRSSRGDPCAFRRAPSGFCGPPTPATARNHAARRWHDRCLGAGHTPLGGSTLLASTMKKPLSMLLGALVLACMGCEPYGGELIRSNKQRLAASAASEAEVREAARGNAELGFDLYHGVRSTPGNVFFSPYSVSLALGMTYAGARGETAAEMAGALSFGLPDAQLHPAFNAIDLALAGRDDSAKGPFQLNVVNALWTQKGFQFKPEFLDTLAESYGAGMRALDFETSAEESRKIINNWVSYHTNSRIPELLG